VIHQSRGEVQSILVNRLSWWNGSGNGSVRFPEAVMLCTDPRAVRLRPNQFEKRLPSTFVNKRGLGSVATGKGTPGP